MVTISKKNISFEEALEKLEKTVQSLESGELPLNQIFKLFEEGVGLVKTCQEKLDEVEKKVEVLLLNMNMESKQSDNEGQAEKSGH